MMKLTLSQNKILLLLHLALLLSQCRDPEGVFYLSDEARKYMIDTTLSSFRMEDNHGITEEFLLNISHELDQWGTDGKAFGEKFRVSYVSAINDFSLNFSLLAGVESSGFRMDWHNYDHFSYDFSTMEVIVWDTGIDYGDSLVIRPAMEPDVEFYHSLEVNGVLYYNIIEIDYSGNEDGIEDRTPVITYYSGEKGLVRFVLKNGVVFERIE